MTLRARTLSSVGPGVDDKRVVENFADFTGVLRDGFGIGVGGSRLERLWTAARAQHEAFLART
jgi:hypothetical protein